MGQGDWSRESRSGPSPGSGPSHARFWYSMRSRHPYQKRSLMSHEQSAESTSAPAIAERVVQVQGTRIATAMNDVPRALLARVPLIVLPAIGPVWSDYRLILERVARERRVFALDWPGFGASDKPAPATFAY